MPVKASRLQGDYMKRHLQKNRKGGEQHNPRWVLKEQKGRQQLAAREGRDRRALLPTGRQATAGDSVCRCRPRPPSPALDRGTPTRITGAHPPRAGGGEACGAAMLRGARSSRPGRRGASRRRGSRCAEAPRNIAAGGQRPHRLRETGSAPSFPAIPLRPSLTATAQR